MAIKATFMRQLYLFWLAAIALLGVSFNAHAEDYSINLEWEEPGSIMIYSSGTGDTNKIALSDGQTSATVSPLSGNKSCYIQAADGYQLVSCIATDGTTIQPGGWGKPQFIIN